MLLFERVRSAAKKFFGSDKGLAEALGIPQSTFSAWLNEKREANLWPHLPAIMALCPEVSRDWLYFDEGEMLLDADDPAPQGHENDSRNILNYLGYYEDALARVFILTGISTTSPFGLQTLFGADFKEAQKFIARYMPARVARQAWKDAGADEESVPPAPEPIPDEWLQYFWTHFGPNPIFVQAGEKDYSHPPILRECPVIEPLERLNAALLEAQQECRELRARLAAFEQGEAAGGTEKATKPHTAPMPKSAPGEKLDAGRD